MQAFSTQAISPTLAALCIACPLQAHANVTAPDGRTVPPEPATAAYRLGSKDLQTFYELHGERPVWWREGAWAPAAQAVLRILVDADRHGLDPRRYDPDRLRLALAGATDGGAGTVEADRLLTETVVRYLDDLHAGHVAPESVGWDAVRKVPVDGAAMLAYGLQQPDFVAWLADAGPGGGAYSALLRARADLTPLSGVDWPHLADGPTLDPGGADPRVAAAREQLRLLGDLAPAVPTSPEDLMPHSAMVHFDSDLEAAVRGFQARHGLTVDGRIGSATRAALNRTPRQRIEQIDANLERLRWLPADLGRRHIRVNLAGFELEAVEDGRVTLRMPVVVGLPDWQTPVLSDRITDLKFAPNWTVPVSIARREMLPQVRRDPGYLHRKSMRVLRGGSIINPDRIDWSIVSAGDYVFQQDPGPQNALGQIRFSLTNPRDIYLHDTPSKRHFRRAGRALSHGCVRVGDPVALAAFVLREEGDDWSPQRIVDAMNAPRTHFHHLSTPVPVHLVYQTAWVDEDGTVQFREDIYGHDQALVEVMQARGNLVAAAR